MAQEYYNGDSIDVIGERHSIHRATIWWCFKRSNVKIRSKRESRRSIFYDDHIFNIIDTEQKAYWLGFLMGDGNVLDSGTVGLNLHIRDKDHVQKYATFLGGNTLPKTHKGKSCHLRVRSPQMALDLKRYGIVPRKSLTAVADLSSIPEDLHVCFWRGILDADGWACINKQTQYRGSKGNKVPFIWTDYRCGICGSIRIVTAFCAFVKDRLDIDKIPKSHRSIHNVSFSGAGCLRVLDLLYNKATIFLDRKMTQYNLMTQGFKYA